MTNTQTQPPPILGVDHIKIPTASVPAKLAFYTSVLSFTHLAHFDHKRPSGELFAVILQHAPTGLLVELRLNPAQAAAQHGWDAVTWSVESHADLETWRAFLGERGVECSRVLKGFKGWVLVAEDPDGAMVRWYCKETHEWDENIDVGACCRSRLAISLLILPQTRNGFQIEGRPPVARCASYFASVHPRKRWNTRVEWQSLQPSCTETS
jgi:catechol 2,3-dioxygenase-like lactoylglutathione lyase family enzyme